MSYLRKGDSVPEKGRGSRLTGKMLLFVEAYSDASSDTYQHGTRSVLRAGYKTSNPNRLAVQLMQHPLVIEGIKHRQEIRLERNELTVDYVLQKLMTLVEATDKDSDRIRALELLGKSLSLFKERQEISGPDGEAIKYEQKVKEDVADFTSRLSRLAQGGGSGEVVKFPDGRGEG